MGQVIFDEKDKPLMRMTYQGLSDDAEWQRHIDQMSEWARRGDYYAGTRPTSRASITTA